MMAYLINVPALILQLFSSDFTSRSSSSWWRYAPSEA